MNPRMAIIVAAALAAITLAPPHAGACGDRFLVSLDRDSRGSNLPLAKAQRRATILLYRPPNSEGAPGVPEATSLARVGHDVQMCDSAMRCTEAVKSGAFQIVLADYRDLEALNVEESASGVRLLPVVSGAAREEVKRIKERFGVVFDSGAPVGKLLATVDRLTAAR